MPIPTREEVIVLSGSLSPRASTCILCYAGMQTCANCSQQIMNMGKHAHMP